MMRNSHKWTETEDQILKAAVDQGKLIEPFKFLVLTTTPIDWLWIASYLPKRDNKDCRKRWHQRFAGSTNFGSWMDIEDDQLRAAVAKHGPKWGVVSKEVSTRTSDQCSKRWKQVLDPNLDHSPWSPAEDNCLLIGVEQHGRNWKMLSEMHFKNRAALSLKNRHALLVRRKNRLNGLPRVLSAFQSRSRSHSPNFIATAGYRNSRQLSSFETSSDADMIFEEEIQDERIASVFDGNGLSAKAAQYGWKGLEVANSNAMLETENCWPTDARTSSSSSLFQGGVLDGDLGIGNLFEESYWEPQSIRLLPKCTLPEELQDTSEGLLGSMSPFDSIPRYPYASIDSEEISPDTSVAICSQLSNSPGDFPMTAASGSDNKQLANPTARYPAKDWTNLLDLTLRCTKSKMEAIRKSVFEAANDALCIEENDEDVVELRLRAELRS
ncbi:Homeodomain-like protein [Penicillium waksmanii]|uniref:Homeodomain-like protein n=1 Tax=Penicillium waksmanii TaxID=69791 RepID=UPI002547F590|nr:Homeodomain-like protein [Penicillium waksmanii]KAJ5975334.1 Homeodomain-like protein [Penicillium waksmanii]